MAERSCLVAICTNWPQVPVQTVRSLLELGWGDRVQRAKDAHGFTRIDHAWLGGFPRVDALRDSAVTAAQSEGYTHLLFLDADNVWPSDVLMRLLAHHARGVVGGLYVQKGPPYAPVALVNGEVPEGSTVTHYHHDPTVLTATELCAVEALGMGCTLIPMAVFRDIGARPWFYYEESDEGWPLVSEDIPFCRRAREAGYELWIDPTIQCGHVTQMITDVRWARRYRKGQEEALSQVPVQVSRVEQPA